MAENKKIILWQNHSPGGEELAPTMIPYSKALGGKNTTWMKAVRTLEEELSVSLLEECRHDYSELLAFLLAGIQGLLYRYTGDSQITIGLPYADSENAGGRMHILLHSRPISAKDTFELMIEGNRQLALLLSAAQGLPLEERAEELCLRRLSGQLRTPVLAGLSNFYHFEDSDLALADLAIELEERGGALYLGFLYRADLYEQAFIEQASSHLERLLQAALKNRQTELLVLDMLSAQEKKLVLDNFNRHDMDYPKEVMFHQWFEAEAERHPDAIAVQYKEERLTYRELNARANQLARTLRQCGVKPNELVGILVERCVGMVVSVLAVWKSGAAYVPIDPEYPEERIRFMLEDSEASVLLTQRHLQKLAADWSSAAGKEGSGVLYLEDEGIYDDETANLKPVQQTTDLAYVIYTSGTTGRPKGVMIDHFSFMNTAAGYRREFRLGDFPVRLLQLASFSFDVFVGDIARTFYNGGAMVICPKEDRIDPNRLFRWIRDQQITVFESTPALIIPFMKHVADQGLALSSMKLLITSSDSCSVKDYRWLQERFGSQFRIINSYGVTEAAIDSSLYDEPLSKLPDSGSVPIGRAVLNARFYIVDEALQPVPIGVLGELCIGGDGVAKGYWKRPELTAEKFIASPFVPGERLYRTGDLARWMPDGNVDFVGRMDHQAKIRGYRIEVGEVEAHMQKEPSVREVVVAVREEESGEKALCAYYVADRPIRGSDWRERLSASLPDYMIPSYFIAMDKLPLTANGKVDRKALPQPGALQQHIQAEVAAGIEGLGGGRHPVVRMSAKVTHHALLDSQALAEAYSIRPGERIYQSDSAYMDASCQEMLLPLLHGATLCLPEKSGLPAERSAQYLQENSIAVAHLGEDELRAVPQEELPCLRLVTTNSRTVSPELIHAWAEHRSFSVLYGAAGAGPLIHAYYSESCSSASTGLPLPGKELYVLNDWLQLMPPGIPGELYAGAAGMELALYENGMPERLVDHPWVPGAKLIRTGILARYLENGELQYIGELGLPDAEGGSDAERHSGLEAGISSRAVRNRTEEQLLRIWQEILGREQIGLREDFFAVGGHSLRAMTLLSRIQKIFQVEISLQAILAHPTIEELAGYIKQAQSISYQAISPAEQQAYYPVTSVQQRLYSVQQFAGIGTSYHIPLLLELRGPLQKERLAEALHALVRRHEAFRTSFHLVQGELMQQIHEEVDFRVEFGSVGSDEELEAYAEGFTRPFDLSRAPLFRAAIVELGRHKHYLLMDANHIVYDGLSGDTVLDELMKLYRGEILPALPIQYKDYAVWQHNALEKGGMKRHEEYWLEQFKGPLPALELPADYPRPAIKKFDGDLVTVPLPEELKAKLARFMEEHQASLYATLLSVYGIMLSKYANEEDIVVGTTTAGRSHPDLESVVGMFANTLGLRLYPDASKPFAEFLAQVKETVFGALEHEEYPLEELIRRLGLQRDISRNPLFDTMFVLEAHSASSERFMGIEHNLHNPSWKYSKLDLTWYVQEGASGQLQILVEYSTQLFMKATIQRMAGHYLQLLAQAIDNPQAAIQELACITEGERRQILTDFNNTRFAYPPFRPLHVIFEEQAEQTPDAVALLYGGGQMTYREVNERANQLGRRLRAHGVGRDQAVGILFDRSFEMMISILAVLKAGGAYMPLSPEFPRERIEYMASNSRIKLLLTERKYADLAEGLASVTIYADQPEAYGEDGSNLAHIHQERDLAYILYTSGSTGRPKGVMIEHYTVYNRIAWMVKEYGISREDVFLQKTPYVFDVSVWELFMWFFTGASLCLLPAGEEKAPDRMIDCMHRSGVTSIHFVPSMLGSFLDFMEMPAYMGQLARLRRIFTSGEALLPSHVARFQQAGHAQARLYNLYGPTEATIDVSYYHCPVQGEPRTVPIGKPIDNVQLFILNRQDQLQPVGVPGELCISGACLARGYMNRDDLTLASFVPNPYLEGQLMYRTGDLARWLPDGNIEYLGRIDNQVKIRGYRIELDEITTRLLEIEGVREAAAIARQDAGGAPYLCAYYVGAEQGILQPAAMKSELLRSLPDYMVPAHFIEMPALPVNHNGKLDRKALPEPAFTVEKEYEAPESEKERLLVEIWEKVLHVGRVGVNDNFFELGGDSIKAIHVAAQLNQHELKIDMTEFFQNPTVRALAPLLKEGTIRAEQGIVRGDGTLTPIQQWFFEQPVSNRNHWNQSVLLQRASGWDIEAVKQAWSRLTEHHDALRIVFREEEGGRSFTHRDPDAEIFGFDSWVIDEDNDITAWIREKGDELHRSLDIEEGPLIRLGHFRSGEGEYLLIVMHHLIVDGVSWSILLEDFAAVYGQIDSGQPVRLPAKTTSFLDWSKQLQDYADSDEFLNQLSYWKDIDSQVEACAALPAGVHACEAGQRYKEVELKLDGHFTEQLLTTIHQAYRTEVNDILLAALTLAVTRWTGEESMAVSLEGHGREQLMAGVDLSRTVGWFTSLYPVVFRLQSSAIPHVIKAVKETLRSVPHKGAGYGILRYMTSPGSKGHHRFCSQPRILFNYLGQLGAGEEGGFKLSDAPAGSAASDYVEPLYWLEINGMVVNGELRLVIGYDAAKFDLRTMEELRNSFKEHLEQVIQHCAEAEGTELTPSDFSARELSLEELDDIFEALKQ
ncbi:non-ribosomal peptide synthetase [Paenibacillus ihumii]|uniref:non-ribosomal peptide synthetase n=1 Tax=Paenibacillus ihumii TaxID=687436 RepID=UPI0006D816D1|nr:non-ribosomal peptide synthetase [Paenibacillus ihumii]